MPLNKLEHIELWLWRFRDVKTHDEAIDQARIMAREIMEITSND